jgi:hypothetical protein
VSGRMGGMSARVHHLASVHHPYCKVGGVPSDCTVCRPPRLIHCLPLQCWWLVHQLNAHRRWVGVHSLCEKPHERREVVPPLTREEKRHLLLRLHCGDEIAPACLVGHTAARVLDVVVWIAREFCPACCVVSSTGAILLLGQRPEGLADVLWGSELREPHWQALSTHSGSNSILMHV